MSSEPMVRKLLLSPRKGSGALKLQLHMLPALGAN